MGDVIWFGLLYYNLSRAPNSDDWRSGLDDLAPGLSQQKTGRAKESTEWPAWAPSSCWSWHDSTRATTCALVCVSWRQVSRTEMSPSGPHLGHCGHLVRGHAIYQLLRSVFLRRFRFGLGSAASPRASWLEAPTSLETYNAEWRCSIFFHCVRVLDHDSGCCLVLALRLDFLMFL